MYKYMYIYIYISFIFAYLSGCHLFLTTEYSNRFGGGTFIPSVRHPCMSILDPGDEPQKLHGFSPSQLH